ncbi:hypothetical protein Acr_00g0094400 [Actinidia rufa]|uniref:Uncharacterized protein n=1 Tax=Actinidia rufa TaxID=165716 RepID=A0A7J0DY11_9ERIC|nr:hypothetical protein Acr_00g0094400 [Actinidia rufa]
MVLLFSLVSLFTWPSAPTLELELLHESSRGNVVIYFSHNCRIAHVAIRLRNRHHQNLQPFLPPIVQSIDFGFDTVFGGGVDSSQFWAFSALWPIQIHGLLYSMDPSSLQSNPSFGDEDDEWVVCEQK